MRHLRVHGTTEKWSAKLVEEYDIDDKHHKQAITNLINDLASLAVVRNYYIDRDTLLELYDKHIGGVQMRNETINATIAKQYTDWHIKHGGFARDMTMRDYFAALAMQALLRDDDVIEIWRGIPADAYEMADAMLKERIK